jgi:tetratricopeptide (TPR) repeat protein
MAGALATQAVPVVRDSGQHPQAQKLLEDLLRVHVQNANKRGIADTLYNLGLVMYNTGNASIAEQHFLKAQSLFEEFNDKVAMAQTSERLGVIACEKHHHREAEAYFRRALSLAFEAEAIPLALYVLSGFAKLLSEENHKDRAVELLAFVLHHPDTQERTQDAAESLMFEFESKLAPSVIEKGWERGKSRRLEELVAEFTGTSSPQ